MPIVVILKTVNDTTCYQQIFKWGWQVKRGTQRIAKNDGTRKSGHKNEIPQGRSCHHRSATYFNVEFIYFFIISLHSFPGNKTKCNAEHILDTHRYRCCFYFKNLVDYQGGSDEAIYKCQKSEDVAISFF